MNREKKERPRHNLQGGYDDAAKQANLFISLTKDLTEGLESALQTDPCRLSDMKERGRLEELIKEARGHLEKLSKKP